VIAVKDVYKRQGYSTGTGAVNGGAGQLAEVRG